MKWPTIDQMSAMAPLPDGYRYEQLGRADIPALIESIKLWHPDIAVGGGSCYLRQDFYTDKVHLDDDALQDIYVGLFRRGDELVGMWSWEQVPDALSLYGRLIIVAPAHRDAKLASKVMPLAELAGRVMGAEFFFGLATLKIPHMQRALESAGWQLIGFTSGYDREQVAPGVIKRVFEGVYTKVLVPEEELLRPDPNNLTPNARLLFQVLFPDTPAAALRPHQPSGHGRLAHIPSGSGRSADPGLRADRQRAMKWPTIDELTLLLPLPAGYRFQRLTRAKVAPLISALRTWHPDIAVGAASGYLREGFYDRHVYFDGETDRDIWVVPIMFKDELVGVWSVEREVDSLAIYGRTIIVAPAHRGANIALFILKGADDVGHAMGAAFLYAMATLKIPHAQRALEAAGYRLLGLFPGYDREEVAPGVVKRVYQAVYAKLLVADEEVLRPDPKNLTPKARALFELLFSNEPVKGA